MQLRGRYNLEVVNRIEIQVLRIGSNFLLENLLWGINDTGNTKLDKGYKNDLPCFKILQYFWENYIIAYKGKYIKQNSNYRDCANFQKKN